MPDVPPPPAPAETTVVAGARRPVFDAAEVWAHRDLLRFLVWRQIRARYKQAVLGIVWALVRPIVAVLVFTIVFGKLAGVPSEGVAYPVFAYLGILAWQLFAETVTRSTQSLVANSSFLTEVYFPRVLVPLSAAAGAVVDWGIAFVVLLVVMAVYGVAPAASIVWLVPLLALEVVVAAGIGMGLAALNVQFRDIGHVVPFLLQAWMFLTPVVYPAGLVPEGWRFVYALNPMVGFVDAQRDAVLGRPTDLAVLAVSSVSGLVLAWVGARLFRRMEARFADVV